MRDAADSVRRCARGGWKRQLLGKQSLLPTGEFQVGVVAQGVSIELYRLRCPPDGYFENARLMYVYSIKSVYRTPRSPPFVHDMIGVPVPTSRSHSVLHLSLENSSPSSFTQQRRAADDYNRLFLLFSVHVDQCENTTWCRAHHMVVFRVRRMVTTTTPNAPMLLHNTSIPRSKAVTIKHVLRQILELPESASSMDGVER